MKVFIVHAHPEPNSFNGALTKHAKTVLERNGSEVEVSDLYAMNFNPVTSRKNFVTTKDPDYFKQQLEEVYAAEHDGFAPDIKAEMEKLLWCDCLIFQFPLHWFSVPAILKGWVDRVFAMGFAYGRGDFRNGALRGKKAMISLTASFNQPVEFILYHVEVGMFTFCGLDVLPHFFVPAPARISPKERHRYLEQYEVRLLTLAETKPKSLVL